MDVSLRTPTSTSSRHLVASVAVLRSNRRLAALALGLLTLVMAGCQKQDARVAVYPVNGKVTFKGEAPSGAFVAFHAAQPLPADTPTPTAKVQPDGSFSLTTFEGNDGAPSGEYAVTIQWSPIKKVGAEYKALPNVIPTKYADAASSPWKVSIRDTPNDLPALDITK
jgi:hypothetical protein